MLRSFRLLTVFALSVTVAACTDDSSDDNSSDEAADSATDTDADSDSDTTSGCDAPTLELENNTGNTIEIVHFQSCDLTDGHDFPIPAPGVVDGESASIPFPGPGCWYVEYEGEGCRSDVAEMPGELDCGGTHSWAPGEENHICQG